MSSAATGFGEGAKRRPALVRTLAILGAACGLWALIASCFAVDVTEYAVVTRFGRVLSVISAPGLYFKVPFDSVVRVDRRLLLTRPAEAEFLSEDKKNIVVDSCADVAHSGPEALSRNARRTRGGGGAHRRYRGGRDRRGHWPFQCQLVHHGRRGVEPVRLDGRLRSATVPRASSTRLTASNWWMWTFVACLCRN